MKQKWMNLAKTLKLATGASSSLCRKALLATNGNYLEAIAWIKNKKSK